MTPPLEAEPTNPACRAALCSARLIPALYVVESVFSGMARAIIANSNYQSVDEARAAIERYVQERNKKFRCKPKRAGGKIWGMEREPPRFSTSNNCKDPRYR